MPFDGTHISERARVLINALELLRRDGWCQRASIMDNGEMCILGALWVTDGKQKTTPLDMAYFTTKSAAEIIIRFNDAKKRTFAEVEAWFEEQIAAAMAVTTG